MREILELIKRERRARLFFVALGQSALGTGAALVALLVIAFERFESPWAIGLVLLADVVPGMLLGPLFGAVADRWSRRSCVIVADVIRVIAFAGLVVVDDFTLTVAFALVAGIGTALFQPASLAALPGLVEPARLPAATSLYGALMDVGFVAGPAIAAGFMLAGGPEAVLVANAVTFGLSAVLLASIHFGDVPARADEDETRPSLIRDVRAGLAAAARIPGLTLLLLASAGALFFGGLFNVAELLLATDELGASEEGFSTLLPSMASASSAGQLQVPGEERSRYCGAGTWGVCCLPRSEQLRAAWPLAQRLPPSASSAPAMEQGCSWFTSDC